MLQARLCAVRHQFLAGVGGLVQLVGEGEWSAMAEGERVALADVQQRLRERVEGEGQKAQEHERHLWTRPS